MKFRFNLERVMKHRKTVENQAQKDFQETLAALNVEIEKQQKMQEDLHEAQTYRGELAVLGGRQGPGWQSTHEYLKGQEIRIKRQAEVIAQCQARVEEKREILLYAAKEYKIIESLKDKKFKAFKEERNYREQVLTDDLNVMRYKREKS